MFNLPLNFFNKIQKGQIPIIYVVVVTDKGSRAYSQNDLSGVFLEGNTYLDWAGRLKNISSLERAIQSQTRDSIDNLSNIERQTQTVVLDNTDFYFSKLLPLEPFLTKTLYVYSGFEADALADHIQWFRGKITVVELIESDLNLMAEEK